MPFAKSFALFLSIGLIALPAISQQSTSPELKIDRTNRTLSVSATEEVSVDPDIAVLHIGFETPPADAKTVHTVGAKTSAAIIAALKQAGISESDIHSESQWMSSFDAKQHRFTLNQQWTVSTQPARAAEILDIAISNGATQSGQIEWSVKDMKALEDKALRAAVTRVRDDAVTLSEAMGVHMGDLIYTYNEVSLTSALNSLAGRSYVGFAGGMVYKQKLSSPLTIEPNKVIRRATVYAVYAIQ